jgi:hypothetical protein
MAKAKKDTEAEPQVYDVPALVITPEKAPAVTGNYNAIEAVLEKWSAKVLSMTLTEDNLDEVLSIKKAAVAVRGQIDTKVDATKKALFNDPKRIFEARMKSLYALVAKVEGAADEVLGKLEQERVDGINEVLEHYIEKFQEQYDLDGERLDRIERKKSYYNKTADEKARKDDIEQQFKDLKKEQDTYAANIRLIKMTCGDEPRLNVDRYVRDLAVSDVATVVEEINAEKQRLRELDKKPATRLPAVEDAEYEVVEGEGAASETAPPLKIGIPSHIDFGSDFKGRMRSATVKLSYYCDQGEALTEVFAHLRQFGVKAKFVEEKEPKPAKEKETVF